MCTACSPDGFPYWFWWDYALHLAPVITRIFITAPLDTKQYPWCRNWLTYHPFQKSQLQPISLTNIMRIFEKLVCKQELSLAIKSQILSDQFAYKGHHTTMVLLKWQHLVKVAGQGR